MKIVIIKGIQHFDMGDEMYAMILDGNGEPLAEDTSVDRWVQTAKGEFLLVKSDRVFH